VSDFIVLGVLFIALTVIALSPKGAQATKVKELLEKKKDVQLIKTQK
jgi:hypothetical protein